MKQVLASLLLLKLFGGADARFWEFQITNIARDQPWSPFWVMIGHRDAEEFFHEGRPATGELAILAEYGDPEPLVKWYNDYEGLTRYSFSYDKGAPFFLGPKINVRVETDTKFSRVSIATKMLNTNDVWTGFKELRMIDGAIVFAPGYDAGTEFNDELCSSVMGPACPEDSGNVHSTPGEGLTYIGNGIHGIGDLDPTIYDWRNPCMRIKIEEVEHAWNHNVEFED